MKTTRLLGAFLTAAALAGAGMAGPLSPPDNDDFPGTTVIGTSVDVWGSNVDATRQSGEPNPFSVSGAHSVWWNWTAPWSGPFAAGTGGSDFNTTLGVYTGDSVSTLKRVAENDEGPFQTSTVAIFAMAGTVYRIQVNGFHGATGNIQLHLWEITNPLPPNDNFPGPLLSGSTFASGDNGSATAQEGEPNPARVSGFRSVWYTWYTTGSGKVTIDTSGSSFDTTLGVYTGSDLNDLQLLKQNDDIDPSAVMQSRVSFSAHSGVLYRILVNGFDAAAGPYDLHITFTESGGGRGWAQFRCGLIGLESVLAMALVRLMKRAAPHLKGGGS